MSRTTWPARSAFVAATVFLIACGGLLPGPGDPPQASPYPNRNEQYSWVTQRGQHIADQLAASVPGATVIGDARIYDGGDCSPAPEYRAAHGTELVGLWQLQLPPGDRQQQLAPGRQQLASTYTVYATPHPRDLLSGHDPVYELRIAVFEVQATERQAPGRVTIEVRGGCYPAEPATSST